jgi:hypothetical protein
MKLKRLCTLVIVAGTAMPCAAQTGAAPAVAALPTSAAPAGEPNVKRTVIEDDNARIDELKVRGHTQRISVTPKLGPKRGYEIITGDGSRDLSDGANTSRGAAGKRVWNVLSF